MEVKETENRKYAAANRLAKRRRKKIRLAITLISLGVIILGVLAILSCTVFFPISTVSVSGGTIYENSRVIDASGIEIGDKLFGISEREVRENLTTKLPYIKNIQLKRNLFDSVEIIVTETSDKYCYMQNGQFYTADIDNKALAAFDVKPQGTTEIYPPKLPKIELGYKIDIGDDSIDLINQICNILDNADIVVDSLNIENTSSITAIVEGRFNVNFGTVQDIENKTEHLRSMIPLIFEEHGENVTGKINLSVWTSENRKIPFVKTEKF